MISGIARRGTLLFALGAVLVGCGGTGSVIGTTTDPGESATVGASTLTTSATHATNRTTLRDVQVVIPFDVIQNPPSSPGSGNAGAIATMNLPAVAQNNSVLNHVAVRWEPDGHLPAHFQEELFAVPFYRVSPATVGGFVNPDPSAPDSNEVPSGFTFPGVDQAIAELGTRVVSNKELNNSNTFQFTMALIYYNGQLVGLEPMIAREVLLDKQIVNMAVPRPASIGAETQFPTRFTAAYDGSINAYRFTFFSFTNTSG